MLYPLPAWAFYAASVQIHGQNEILQVILARCLKSFANLLTETHQNDSQSFLAMNTSLGKS